MCYDIARSIGRHNPRDALSRSLGRRPRTSPMPPSGALTSWEEASHGKWGYTGVRYRAPVDQEAASPRASYTLNRSGFDLIFDDASSMEPYDQRGARVGRSQGPRDRLSFDWTALSLARRVSPSTAWGSPACEQARCKSKRRGGRFAGPVRKGHAIERACA